jgi:hypothetical protein
VETVANRLIDLFQNTAPQLWQIAMQQNRYYFIADLVWSVVLIGFCFFGVWWIKKATHKMGENQWDMGGPVAIIFTVLGIITCVSVSVGLLGDALNIWINPQFCALRTILSLIPNK